MLLFAGQAMQTIQQMQKKISQLEASKTLSAVDQPLKTPPPKRKAPSTPASTLPSTTTPGDTAESAESDVEASDSELTEQAKRHRLRRLCEKKPSGKINVPMDIHQQWAAGGNGRDQLLDMLEQSGWEKATQLRARCLLNVPVGL